MRHVQHILFFLLLCVSSAIAAHVAVLETIADPSVKKKVSFPDRQYLTNVLREEAVKELPASQNYTIMTRENIREMLPPGKAIEGCEGSCLVETGRNIAADYVCQARVGSFGSKLAISAEIYETSGNKLVASFNGHGANVEELLKVIKENASEFFGKVKGEPEAPKSVERYAGAGGIGDARSLNKASAEEDDEENRIGKVDFKKTPIENTDNVKRSNKPIGEVPAVKNRFASAWLRWGVIAVGGTMLTTGVVLAVVGNTQAKVAHESGFNSVEEYKANKDDAHSGQIKRGIGIALAIIGAAGIGFGFAF